MKMPRTLLNILLATALVVSLAACGNKGPLVHPNKEKPVQEKPAQEKPAQEPASSSN